MKIDLTEEQYIFLMRAVEAGSSAYGILADLAPQKYQEESEGIDDVRAHLFSFASDFGAEVVFDALPHECEEAMFDYDDDTFWFELETRLGQRDFERTMTGAEKKEMEENGALYPEKIHELYESWGKEFERNGIERLGIAEKPIEFKIPRRT